MRTIDGSSLEIALDYGRNAAPAHERGKQCFLYPAGTLVDEAKEYYGKDVALKIFFLPLKGKFEDYYWGTAWRSLSHDRTEEIGYISRLVDATKVQNLAWLGGFAPRVYDLVILEYKGEKYPAQVVEYLQGETGVKEKDNWCITLEKYLNDFGCLSGHKKLIRQKDFIDGKLIDFQGFRPGKDFKKKIAFHVRENGRYGSGHYQSVKELGLGAHPRDTEKRIRYMRFAQIDWEGKSVIDIGCNSGMFCNYAAEHGAKKVVGVDLESNIKAARILAFYFGNHNIDYRVLDLEKETMDEEFDITLYLSMNMHTKFPDWIANNTKELLVFEENAKGSKFQPDVWKELLSKHFDSVKLVGHGNDHGGKPLFHAKKA